MFGKDLVIKMSLSLEMRKEEMAIEGIFVGLQTKVVHSRPRHRQVRNSPTFDGGRSGNCFQAYRPCWRKNPPGFPSRRPFDSDHCDPSPKEDPGDVANVKAFSRAEDSTEWGVFVYLGTVILSGHLLFRERNPQRVAKGHKDVESSFPASPHDHCQRIYTGTSRSITAELGVTPLELKSKYACMASMFSSSSFKVAMGLTAMMATFTWTAGAKLEQEVDEMERTVGVRKVVWTGRFGYGCEIG